MLEDINDSSERWETLFSSALRSSAELSKYLQASVPSVDYPIFIPFSFASKIKSQGPEGPLWKQFVPSHLENQRESLGLIDPISDKKYSKDGGIIHRYKNRILFSPTEVCPIQCRYCFRKNELHTGDPIFKANSEKLLSYLKMNPAINEVIFTGGDPLILSDSRLEALLGKISSIDSVDMIRFHSRTPIILPERLNAGLLQVLSKFQRRFAAITIVVHANHVSEIDDGLSSKLAPFVSAGINFLSQSVILKGVNDCPKALEKLFKKLYSINIKPYYLHHPDSVAGAMHFSISLSEGRRIYRELKEGISGILLPHYIIELPNGAGKSLAHTSQTSTSDKWFDKDGNIVTSSFR